MSTPASLAAAIKHETIQGLTGPCKAYSGLAAAVTTFNGTPVVILAANGAALVAAVQEISPTTKVSPALFVPAVIVADDYVDREEL